ncbi:MAG: type II toxin-antitoxin system Phd/YefM family antitoxin [Nostoc sp. S4]|nr:type II toxin-antitoxin system Phd/YefM family antitoxin [Nostoc sp. S4]
MTYRHIDIDYENLQAVIDNVALEGKRIIIQKQGKSMAAIVPIEELEILQELEELEDEFDLKAAQEAMKEPGIVPWEELKLELGL